MSEDERLWFWLANGMEMPERKMEMQGLAKAFLSKSAPKPILTHKGPNRQQRRASGSVKS